MIQRNKFNVGDYVVVTKLHAPEPRTGSVVKVEKAPSGQYQYLVLHDSGLGAPVGSLGPMFGWMEYELRDAS